jgi:hypothetical protein
MTREWKIRIVAALVLLAALAAGVARKAGWRPADLRPGRAAVSDQDPQGAIYAMLNAARAGDVKSYLGSYAGQMEASLRRMLAESSEFDFAKYLRDSNAAIKGVAVSDPQITGQAASVRVEYVYQDRNEVQTIYLEKGATGWKIVRADGDERIQTLIPYGTPVK